MTFRSLTSGLACLLAVAVVAAAPKSTENKPSGNGAALPAGHPDISGAKPGAGALPSGHPPIGGMGGGGALPSGHPPIGGMGAGGAALPAGHPEIGGMAPTTRPAATHGSISIRAIQGTKDAATPAGDSVVVELYHQQKVIQKIEGKLDDKGILVLEKLPLSLPFQPVVTVTHGGVQFEGLGQRMHGQMPTQHIDVQVYEATEQAPAWTVKMRHVIVEPHAEGVRVVEMLAIENPTDRAWLGKALADGKRESVSVQLAEGAEHLEVGGLMHMGCSLSTDGRLVNNLPLMPGLTRLEFAYVLHMKSGPTRLNITAPAPVGQLMVFAPADGTVNKAEGIESAGSHAMGESKAAVFKGAGLKSGHVAVLTLTPPATATPKGGGEPISKAGGSAAPKIIAGVGGGLILAVGTGIVFLKSPKASKGR